MDKISKWIMVTVFIGMLMIIRANFALGSVSPNIGDPATKQAIAILMRKVARLEEMFNVGLSTNVIIGRDGYYKALIMYDRQSSTQAWRYIIDDGSLTIERGK